MLTVMRPSRARCVKARIPRHERAVLTARPGAGEARAPASTDRHLFQQKIRFNRHKIAWNPKTGKKVTISARRAMVFMVAQIRQTLLATSR